MNKSELPMSLDTVRRTPLKQMSGAQAAKIVRRIVDGERDAPKLDVAAFNSSI
jgi:FXSXX-COOH protein